MAESTACNGTKPYPNDGKLYCIATFDTVRCWDYTLAGSRAYGDCPKSHPASALFSSDGYSFKDCTKNGTWWTHPLSGNPWTNYSTCISHKKIEDSRTLLDVYISGYAVSIVFLIVSLAIFSIFRQLRCTRVTVHKHLFVSYVTSAVLWIIYYELAAQNVEINKNNPIWCRILHVLTQYATLCNYAWMLCEGLYLHAIIAFAFTNKKRLFIICCFIGWLAPILPTVVYVAVRATGSSDKQLLSCWVHETADMWILMGPIILSLVLNFAFLINILRILLSKLRAVNTSESHHYRRTARACLILIPLLGVQYIMMPFHPKGDTFIYDVFKAILIAYQGAFVSLLFCFFNGEVIQCFKKQFKNCCGQYTSGNRISLSTRLSLHDRTNISKSYCESPTKTADYSIVPLDEIKGPGGNGDMNIGQ